MSEAEGFDYFDVAADIGLRGWGPTLEAAFRQTGLGLFALMVSPEGVEEADAREVRAQGETRESLLVNWLNDCLYLHDVEGFVARRIDFTVFEERRLHSLLRGEEVDPSRHRLGTLVKAATYHQLTMSQRDQRWEIRVILDI
ncbi:MAG: archease [Candidatus Rokubacteria bacterium]|nr:archease [Candidatus Rokubacteria bacterium]